MRTGGCHYICSNKYNLTIGVLVLKNGSPSVFANSPDERTDKQRN